MSNYFKSIANGLSTVATGMKITLGHLFKENVTVQYPDVHPRELAAVDKIPSHARNRLLLDPDLCNGCKSCDRICPVKCISIETVKVLPSDPDQPTMKDGSKRKLWLTKYDIDFAKCCFCALCTTVCPTDSIVTTTEFEYSCYDRNLLLYHFSAMSPEKVAEKKKMVADEAAAKAKAAALAAAQEKKEDAGDKQ
jgi:NADH-quinone oxidoreductase subunit I